MHVSGRNVLPIWRIERYSRPRKAINVDLDKTNLSVKTEELVVVRRTSTVEIDEFLQKQLPLEGAILPLAPIVAEPGGEPTFRPLLDLVALGGGIVRQIQEQVRVPTMV